MQYGLIGVYQTYGLAFAAAFLFWVLISVTAHRLAQGVVADRLGDPIPRLTGRLTLNPSAHFGWPSLLLVVLFGVLTAPPNFSGFMHFVRWGRIGRSAIFLAGPFANLIMFALCCATIGLVLGPRCAEANSVGSALRSMPQGIELQTLRFLAIGAMLNGSIVTWNLLPLPGNACTNVLACASPRVARVLYSKAFNYAGYAIIITLILAAVMNVPQAKGIFASVFQPIHDLGFRGAKAFASMRG